MQRATGSVLTFASKSQKDWTEKSYSSHNAERDPPLHLHFQLLVRPKSIR